MNEEVKLLRLKVGFKSGFTTELSVNRVDKFNVEEDFARGVTSREFTIFDGYKSDEKITLNLSNYEYYIWL